MEKNKIAVSIGILAIGVIVGYLLGNSADVPEYAHRMPDGSFMKNDHSGSMEDAMHDMTGALKNKRGEEFDKEFLIQMTIHHQGAVEMAQMVLANSTDEKLRAFAQEIIDVQSREINMMQSWVDSVNTVACPMDARVCPDGSSVGRQGPNCEFANCPGQI